MKQLACLALVLAVASGPVSAATIMLISDQAPSGSRDTPFVAWLQSLGHTVDTSGMSGAYKEATAPFANATKVAALQAADLIIVSRMTNSGDYDNDRTAWNTLDVPLMLIGGYLTRGGTDNRWHWTNGGSGDTNKAVTNIVVASGQGGHPFLAGLTDPITAFDWSAAPGGIAPKVVYLPNVGSSLPAGATLVGTYDSRAMVLDIPAGSTLFNGNVTTAERAMLGHWGYDNGTGDDWGDYITADYKTLLSNMINTMVPEPATLVLLGLGAAATLIRRKR
jgi:hypothetical protein